MPQRRDIVMTVEEIGMDGSVSLGICCEATARSWAKDVNDYLRRNHYDWRVKWSKERYEDDGKIHYSLDMVTASESKAGKSLRTNMYVVYGYEKDADRYDVILDLPNVNRRDVVIAIAEQVMDLISKEQLTAPYRHEGGPQCFSEPRIGQPYDWVLVCLYDDNGKEEDVCTITDEEIVTYPLKTHTNRKKYHELLKKRYELPME